MSELPKMLDKKTIERAAREWDKEVKAKKPFEVHAVVALDTFIGEVDVVKVVRKTDRRGERWSQQLIQASGMDNDLRPPKTTKKPTQRGQS
jgi:hypothetical protein